MKEKRFTLVELIVSVIVISILASIVMVKILDIKNKSIGAAVSNNTRILQTAVDRFVLDNDREYPIKNNLTVTLQKPQLVDVELLASKGYLKKDLDTSKVKKQYYWLDVFGVVWGSTESTVNDISSVVSKDGSTNLEFITPAGAVAYRIYEVTGYNKTGNITNKKDRHYKLVGEVELNKKLQKVSFKIPDSSKTYLISAIDKYEQETVPVGVFYKGPAGFQPIFSGEGTYEFVIESFDEMFWVDFKTLEDKPGASTISYRFKIKDENGVYGNWVEDFKDLPSSKGITIEVVMKADAYGNKPSLYDLNIMYRYAYEEILPNPPLVLTNPESSTNICPTGYTQSTMKDGQWIKNQPKLATYLVNLDDGVFIDKVNTPYFMGYSIINVKYEYANVEGKYIGASGTFDIPSGSCVNIIYTLEEDNQLFKPTKPTNPNEPEGSQPGGPIKPSEPGIPGIGNSIPPDVIICKDNCVSICKDCIPTCLENCVEYCDTHNCTEEEQQCKTNECIEPPVCHEGDTGCTPPVCTVNCSEGPPVAPNPQDKEVNNPDWATLETLRFFANGPLGVPTRWIGMIPEHEFEQDKTRILYRYAKSDGYYWSGEIDEINKVGQSQSIMVIAYLQVHKSVKDNPTQKSPLVKSIRILHEKGAIDLDSIQPTLTILPVKDNNAGRDVFSDETVFDWQYKAYDPKGRKITEIEWSGKEVKYQVGKHTIKARAKNETELWSNWVEYTFEVLPEKPVAKITKSVNSIFLNKSVDWSASQSFDPDGDKIVKTEWRGDKQSAYKQEGSYTVELRVQDSEGNWSDWVQEKFQVTKEGMKIYRLEAEETDITKVFTYARAEGWSKPIKVANEIYSGKSAISLPSNSHSYEVALTFKFTGTGFDLKQYNPKNSLIFLDGTLIDSLTHSGEHNYPVRGLNNEEHILKVEITSFGNATIIDYLDVFSIDDTPSILKIESKPMDKNNIESDYINNKIVSSLEQKSNIYYTLHKDSTVDINVYNKEGNLVKNLITNQTKEGGTRHTHNIVWNGKDSNGEYVDTGSYTVKIKAIGVAKMGYVEKNYIIDVDNEKSLYRLEAEETDITKVFTYARADGWSKPIKVANDIYSGKSAISLPSNSQSYEVALTFNFTGTGFDLKQYNPKNSRIFLDGVVLTTLSYSGEHIYSARNLEDKKHTLKVQITSVNTSTVVDYIDVYASDDTPTLLNVNSKPLDKNNMESNYLSNTIVSSLEQKLNIYYTLHKNSYVSISVVDKNNTVVRTLQHNKYSQGGTINTHSVVWDGKDESGNYVETGKYIAQIKAIGVDRKGTTNAEYLMIVDNKKPISRIEAESLDTTKVVKFTYAPGWGNPTEVSDTQYSQGKGIKLSTGYNGYYTQLTFHFEGTGFDLKQYNPKGVKVFLDGKQLTQLTYTGEHNYSFRDLENKKHTVMIQNTYISESTIIDYLDVYK